MLSKFQRLGHIGLDNRLQVSNIYMGAEGRGMVRAPGDTAHHMFNTKHEKVVKGAVIGAQKGMASFFLIVIVDQHLKSGEISFYKLVMQLVQLAGQSS